MTKTPERNSDPSVLHMSAPLMVSFGMRAAFTFVDTIYASLLGDAAVGAIGLTIPFEFAMIAVWVGLSTGLTSALSRSMGGREGRNIDRYLHATWTLVKIVSPIFLLLGGVIWFAAPRFDIDEELYRAFRIYGSVLIGGSAFTAFWSVIPDSVVKAHQDTRSTMWAGIWSNVTNLALNTIFLFVFHWGIFGIALSTVIGRIAGLVYALRKADHHENRRRAEGLDTNLDPDPAPYRAILSLAIPASLTFLLMAGEVTVINTLLAGLQNSTAAIAAYSIYFRVMMFASMPMIAISVAMLPFAAKRIGAGDTKGLRRGLRDAGLFSLAYAFGFLGPIVLLWGPPLAHRLAESAVTAEYTSFALRITPLAAIATTPFFFCRPVFEAMGRGKPGLAMAVFRYVGLTVPTALVAIRLARSMGQPELYGLLAGLIAVAAVSSTIFLGWLLAALPRATPATVMEGPTESAPSLEIPNP